MLITGWKWIERLMQVLLIIGVAIMVVTCLGQVVARYFFHHPLNWTEELARFIFVWVSYLAAWLAWKYRLHIAVDAVIYIDSPELHRWSRMLVEGLVLALCVYTFWTNISLIRLALTQPSPILQIPMGWIYAGYSVMTLLIACDIVSAWITGKRDSALDLSEKTQ